MSVEPGVVDINVLAYASNTDDPKYAASRAWLEEARDPSATLYVTPQVIAGFYSVITNPRSVAMPSSPAVALRAISALLALPGLSVLPATARAVSSLIELFRHHPVTGPEVFDLQIVATIQANNIQRIYTFNAGGTDAKGPGNRGLARHNSTWTDPWKSGCGTTPKHAKQTGHGNRCSCP
jgi:predicted nucleic acid-binding protein